MSKRHAWTGGPDLRGVFLRGLNVFDASNNLPVSRPQQLDPQNRIVNDLQSDDVLPHSHSISDPGHSHTYSRGGTIDSWGGRIVPSGQSGGMDHINEPLGSSLNKTGITSTNNSTGQETRPKNVAVYYYVKIN